MPILTRGILPSIPAVALALMATAAAVSTASSDDEGQADVCFEVMVDQLPKGAWDQGVARVM